MSRKVELVFAALFALFFIGWLIFDMPVALGLVNSQRHTHRTPGQAQREILTRSLDDLQRLLDVAQRGVVGQHYSARYRDTVGPPDDEAMRHRARPRATASARS